MAWQTQPSSARPRSAWRASSSPTSRRGPIAAAVIAGGVGAAALGVLTTLAEASQGIREWLQWSDAVGPLSGKVLMAVLVWLVAWAVLHAALRRRPYETRRALVVSLVLIAVGVVGTFPTFFQLFGE